MKNKKHDFHLYELPETKWGTKSSLKVVESIEVCEAPNGGLEIRPHGYGDKYSKKGQGTPILLERCEGRLRLIVWADITKDDPTHIIDLEKARE